jgi:hypothetical protein
LHTTYPLQQPTALKTKFPQDELVAKLMVCKVCEELCVDASIEDVSVRIALTLYP